MQVYSGLKRDPEKGTAITLFSWLVRLFICFLEVVPVVAKMFFCPPSVYGAMVNAETRRRLWAERKMTDLEQVGQDTSSSEALPALLFADPIDLATIYVPPAIAETLVEGIAAKGIAEVWFNPGSETAALLARARAAGIDPIAACSIIGIGLSPSRF